MKRFFLVLAAVAAVVFVSPPLRSRAAPLVRPIANPFFAWTTGDRVERLAFEVGREAARRGEEATPWDFQRVLKRMYGSRHDARLDPWGNPYFMRASGGRFRVGSAGPDARRGTADDILSDPVDASGSRVVLPTAE